MDSKQYIESGILESYVLGSVSHQEKREVECMSAIYPEIKTELLSLQEGMEKYIQSIAVKPPESVKINLLREIDKRKKEAIVSLSVKPEGKILPIKNSQFYKYGLVASVALLLAMIAFNYTQNNNYNELKNELVIKSTELEGITNSIIETKNREKLLASNSTSQIELAGTEVSPESKVRVFWNKNSSEIVIIQDELPQATTETQYQLWGLVDGAPVSLGTLDKTELISEVRKISMDKVDAFAITLEVNGGSETPNLEQLYVIGNT